MEERRFFFFFMNTEVIQKGHFSLRGGGDSGFILKGTVTGFILKGTVTSGVKITKQ